MKHKHIYPPNTKLGSLVFLKADVDEPYVKGLFKCTCGIEFITRYYTVITKKTKSCGCLKITKLKERAGNKNLPLTENQIQAVIADIKLNDKPMRVLVEKHRLSISKIAKIRTQYYANT